MFKSAWDLRQSKYAGERWDQFKLDSYEENGKQYTRYWSVKAYAPFSLYFWAAEALLHPERMTGKDYMEAVVGLNKISGTGLVFLDVLRAKNAESVKDYMMAFANAYIGSWTVPARTAKDIITGFNPEEGYTRFLKDNARYGPFAGAINNIPVVSRNLPISNNPLESNPNKVVDAWDIPSPWVRQATGLSFTRKNETQMEVDRIGLDWGTIYPKTPIPEVNNAVAGIMAPIAEKLIPNVLLKNKMYKAESVEGQRFIMGTWMKIIKNMSLASYKMQNPQMAVRLEYENISDDQKAVLKQKMQPWVWERLKPILEPEK
jgi:hypothetical protein